MTEKRPLVLDVDGTFLATDMLVESFWAGLGRAPLATLRASLFAFSDRARLKSELARLAGLRTDLLPVNPSVAARVAAAEAEEREVVLASASDKRLVGELAAHHGLSSQVFGSSDGINLKGARKAEALSAAYGRGGFDYAGDSSADRPVWQAADRALVVGNEAEARRLEAAGADVDRLAGGWRWRKLAKALRPHQWVKNVLLFVPLLAAHAFALGDWGLTLAAALAFSLAASSIYVVNDLLDLAADRQHETKRNRPFASGAVPITIGMTAGAGAGLAALALAAVINPGFLGIVAFYMAFSLAYSLRLKRLRWADVGTLAALYTLRVMAGAIASGVGVSAYLLAFIFPVFFALGAVKRLIELARAKTDARLPGRGYGRKDRPALLRLALAAGATALVAFFAYSFTGQAAALYPTRWLIWAALLPIAWWLARMIRLGWLGKQDYDPILFAMRDKRGIGLLLITLGLMFQAAGLWSAWFAG